MLIVVTCSAPFRSKACRFDESLCFCYVHSQIPRIAIDIGYRLVLQDWEG
jgi:hypothetical protein